MHPPHYSRLSQSEGLSSSDPSGSNPLNPSPPGSSPSPNPLPSPRISRTSQTIAKTASSDGNSSEEDPDEKALITEVPGDAGEPIQTWNDADIQKDKDSDSNVDPDDEWDTDLEDSSFGSKCLDHLE